MMTPRLPERSGEGRAGLRLALCWLFLILFPITSFTQDPPAPLTPSSPGEEVSSLPLVGDSSGLTFLGGLRELRALSISAQGTGRIDVQRLDRRLLAVTFVGDFRVSLDRAALARSSVGVLFKGGAPYQGGVAILQIGGSAPQTVPAERVPLPLVRLASVPRAMGDLVTLDATSPRFHRTHILANFDTTRVTLFQRSR